MALAPTSVERIGTLSARTTRTQPGAGADDRGDRLPDAVKQVQELYAQATAPAVSRSREEIARFFDALELVRPGIVEAASWRAGPLPAPPGRALLPGGMARKR